MKISAIKICPSCNKEFPVMKKERHQKFCSRPCAQIVSLPKFMAARTPEVRAKAIAASRAAWHGQELMGHKFDKLTVISRADPIRDKLGNKMWIAKCDCGKEIIRSTADLNSRARHCGCSFPKGEKSSAWLGCGEITGSRLSWIRSGAKKRGFSCVLTCEYLWNLYQNQKGCCAISGLPIIIMPISKSRKNAISAASLDRIDSNIGYIEGNVQWTSLAVNMMKKNYSENELLTLCSAIVKHSKIVEKGEVK